MKKTYKAMHSSKKELSGTLLFLSLLAAIVLMTGLQEIRTEAVAESGVGNDAVVDVDAQSTRMVHAAQSQETRVQ